MRNKAWLTNGDNQDGINMSWLPACSSQLRGKNTGHNKQPITTRQWQLDNTDTAQCCGFTWHRVGSRSLRKISTHVLVTPRNSAPYLSNCRITRGKDIYPSTSRCANTSGDEFSHNSNFFLSPGFWIERKFTVIRNTKSVNSFKNRLQTHLFKVVF